MLQIILTVVLVIVCGLYLMRVCRPLRSVYVEILHSPHMLRLLGLGFSGQLPFKYSRRTPVYKWYQMSVVETKKKINTPEVFQFNDCLFLGHCRLTCIKLNMWTGAHEGFRVPLPLYYRWRYTGYWYTKGTLNDICVSFSPFSLCWARLDDIHSLCLQL